jgi:hypothetical protein
MVDNLISKAITLLTNNWNSSNTDDVTPIIANLTEYKRIGDNDRILIHNISNIPKDNASGGVSKMRSQTIAITIHTFISEQHAINMNKEIERIINNNPVDPFGDQSYDICDVTDVQDNHEQSRNYWKIKILVKFQQFHKLV